MASGLLAVAAAATAALSRPWCRDGPGVVILGFDGADAGLVELWMDEGRLPNLSRLRSEGTYAPLIPINPPQTTVSRSSFAPGWNPGRTEIFDILKRDPGDYLPGFAMTSESRRTFLFGSRNGPVLGLSARLVAFCLGPAALGFVPTSRRLRIRTSRTI